MTAAMVHCPAAQIEELGEWFYDWMFAADDREAARLKARAANDNHAARVTAPAKARRAKAARDLDAFAGEKPTPELVGKAGAEIVRLSMFDPKARGRAVRVGESWRPALLYKRGRISKRQYAAAKALVEAYEAGGFGAMKGQSWKERVDGSPVARGPDGNAAARARYMRAIERMPAAMREVVDSVVIAGRTLDEAARRPALNGPWMPNHEQRRRDLVGALLACALDGVADTFGL